MRVAPAAGRPARTAEPAALPRNGGRGLGQTFAHALAGWGVALRTQRNMRVHMVVATSAVVVGILLELGPLEMAALVLSITLVVALELVNTALEAAVDLSSPALHPLARRAKDVAAGAVLAGACGAAAVGALLFVPRLMERLGGHG
ncbi:MAG: diacylglycerol kinase family protein [Chloroflexi bacterium]|nr:diacylglycerol kinase family protein [Chloroflexota bacterium]